MGGRWQGDWKAPCRESIEETASIDVVWRPSSVAVASIIAAMSRAKPGVPALEVVEPVGKRVLIRKDEDRKVTKVGIHLPDKMEIPTLTDRIVAVSRQVARDEDYPVKQYDKVLFNPRHAIPVDFEGDNRLFVVPVEDVVAVFRRDADA